MKKLVVYYLCAHYCMIIAKAQEACTPGTYSSNGYAPCLSCESGKSSTSGKTSCYNCISDTPTSRCTPCYGNSLAVKEPADFECMYSFSNTSLYTLMSGGRSTYQYLSTFCHQGSVYYNYNDYYSFMIFIPKPDQYSSIKIKLSKLSTVGGYTISCTERHGYGYWWGQSRDVDYVYNHWSPGTYEYTTSCWNHPIFKFVYVSFSAFSSHNIYPSINTPLAAIEWTTMDLTSECVECALSGKPILNTQYSYISCIAEKGFYGFDAHGFEPCPIGTTTLYTDSETIQECIPNKGYYGMAGRQATSCPENMTTKDLNSVSKNDCYPKPGYFSKNLETPASICPWGYYCVGFIFEDPIPCPFNQFTAKLGASNKSDCTQKRGPGRTDCSCMTGTYLFEEFVPMDPSSNKTTVRYSCKECPPGHIYKDPQSPCVPCPPGFVCSISLELAKPCAKGWYRPSQDSTCLPCPAGTFSNVSNSTLCIDCPIGTFNPFANSSSCSNCNFISGFYAPNARSKNCIQCLVPRTLSNDLTCECPANTYYAPNNLNPCVQCTFSSNSTTQCHSNATMTVCPRGSNKDISKCTCKPGYNGDGVFKCEECLDSNICICTVDQFQKYV